ncbi:MAG TPA: PEP-CTERM sorting domain-containing protein [Candidatus Saccharimonadales bacterium]|nr:PEP-CTERM sorting domain-containing protein [Candidatus Saccharimonadales bacterium]
MFSENVGADESVVIQKGLHAFGFNYSQGLPTQFFDTIFTFDHPFLYDPRAGNLLVEMRTYSIFYPFPVFGSLDAVAHRGDSVSDLLATSADATSGRLSIEGFIMQFGYTQVPEPSTIALLVLTVLLAVLMRRSRHIQGAQTHFHD